MLLPLIALALLMPSQIAWLPPITPPAQFAPFVPLPVLSLPPATVSPQTYGGGGGTVGPPTGGSFGSPPPQGGSFGGGRPQGGSFGNGQP